MADWTKGTEFHAGDGATPELFTAVAALASVGGPSLSRDAIETTDLDDAARTFLAGNIDSGEVTLDLVFEPDAATHDALADKVVAAAGTVDNYQVCWPNIDGNAQTVTVANATDIWTAAGHGLTTGQPVRLTTTTTLPAGAAAGTTYYVLWLDANTFTLHTTNAGAVAGTGTLDVSDDGTGTHSVTSGNRWDFAAIATNFEPSAPLGERLAASVTFKVTASVTV